MQADEGEHSAERTVAELATLIHRHQFFAQVLAALFVERSVEDAVGLCNVEGVSDQMVHLFFINYYH